MATSVITCPKCLQLNTTRRITCKICGVNLKQAFKTELEKVDEGKKLSLSERADILSHEIMKFTNQGFRVVSRTDISAQLVKPKEPFDFLIALLWFLLLVVGLLIYILYHFSKRDEAIYLVVSKTGKVLVSGTTPSHDDYTSQ